MTVIDHSQTATVTVPTLGLRVRSPEAEEYDLHLGLERIVFGRADSQRRSNVDVAVEDRHVSRRHCELIWQPSSGRWRVRDLRSSNGTYVDGEALDDAPWPVVNGSEIRIGATVVLVLDGADPALAGSDGADFPDQGDSDGTRVLGARFPDAEDGSGTQLFGQPGTGSGDEDGTAMMRPSGAGGHGFTTLLTPGAVSFDDEELGTVTMPAPGQGGGRDADPDGATWAALPRRGQTLSGQTIASSAPTELPGDRTEASPPRAETPHSVSRATLGGTTSGHTAETRAADPRSSETRRGSRRGAAAPPEQEHYNLHGIAAEAVAANYLEPQKANALGQQAREHGKTFFRILSGDASVRFIDDIYKLAARRTGLELIDSEKVLIDRAVEHRWLSYNAAANLGALMLSASKDDGPAYATIDPFDIELDDWITRNHGGRLNRVIATPLAFQSAVQRLRTRSEEADDATNVLVINFDAEAEAEVHAQVESAGVPELVNYFLQKSFIAGASDIHIEPTEDFLLVRTRVDGILHDLTSLPVTFHPEIVSRIKILSGMDVAEKRRPQDGRIASMIRDNPIDVRVSSYPTIYGEKVVMRLLDKNALRPSPQHLGMIARDLRLLYDKLDAPFGLVMISGPTGSGKTTTLYSCLSYIDKKTKNVLTVEDPVEYRLRGVHQMQVNEKIGLTFASGLRTILRQDPDVIMVGECRDKETAAMAIQAALTGHIVFSTIHTNDAVGVVTRLIDMGVDSFLVANALSLCIAQRLVRRVCKHCQSPVDGSVILDRLQQEGVSDERLKNLGIEVNQDFTYVIGTGCSHCHNTGYSGRQAVFEMFEITNSAREVIMSPRFNAEELRRMARMSGMTTLIGHGLTLVEEGMTSHAEVIRVLGESY